jgi:hypothetical protein
MKRNDNGEELMEVSLERGDSRDDPETGGRGEGELRISPYMLRNARDWTFTFFNDQVFGPMGPLNIKCIITDSSPKHPIVHGCTDNSL